MKIDTLYSTTIHRPEMLSKIHCEPLTLKQKIMAFVDDCKRILMLAAVFFFWALSLSILIRI